MRAHVVSAGLDASVRMLVPRLHVFLPKIGRLEETMAANMALLPGKYPKGALVCRTVHYACGDKNRRAEAGGLVSALRSRRGVQHLKFPACSKRPVACS